MTTRVAGIVLAGGKSKRMGTDKALLSCGDEDFIERAIHILKPVADAVFLSCAQDRQYCGYDSTIVLDEYSASGPLAGMISAMRNIPADVFLFLPIDTPLIPSALYERMVAVLGDYDAVVPQRGGYLEPLCAVYRVSCLAAMEKAMQAGERKIKAFYPDVRLRILKESEYTDLGNPEEMFLNINKQAHYDQLRKWNHG